MAEYTHLGNAPIKEALIDIRVVLPDDFDVQKLQAIQDHIADRYPKKGEKRFWMTRVELKSDAPPKEESYDKGIVGYHFTSTDGLFVLQARLDGFTLSRLKPYETWESMRDEAKDLWRFYTDVAKPKAITRVATRYINVLELPPPIGDFNEYLTSAPVVPEKLPQGLSSFLTRVIMHYPRLESVAIITQALEPSANPKVISIILDIDVFKEMAFDNEEDAWAMLEKLREFKNTIFFESITEKTVGLYR
jgi:uncharacterized protein (TIGR04255 family)